MSELDRIDAEAAKEVFFAHQKDFFDGVQKAAEASLLSGKPESCGYFTDQPMYVLVGHHPCLQGSS